MKDKDLHNDDWLKESRILKDLEKKVEKDTPDGYFENLPSMIMSRIKEQAEPLHSEQVVQDEGKSLPAGKLITMMRWQKIAAAASIVLLIGIGIFSSKIGLLSQQNDLASIQNEIRQLDSESLINHLSMSDIHEDELFAMMDDASLDGLDLNYQDLESDDLMDYIDEFDVNDLDLSDLDLSNENLF